MIEQRVLAQGVKVGDVVRDRRVLSLDGEEVALASLWKEKPLLLVTGSMTCPISVESCPSLRPLRAKHDARLAVAVLYVREAHPSEGGKQPKQDAAVSGAGRHPQPLTDAERIRLAGFFRKEFTGEVPVYVAPVDDRVVRELGTGPNSALSIDRSGRVVAKQGWYDAEGLSEDLQRLLGDASNLE
jgi:hypothetical protein